MRAISILGVTILLVALTSAAHAEVQRRTPRRFWIGVGTGIGVETVSDDPDDPGSNDSNSLFLFGLDAGVQRISGGKAISLDTELYPLSGVYRARLGIVLGHGFLSDYRVPCSPGANCALVYRDRPVRSVIGLKLGVEAGLTPEAPYGIFEAGLGIRGQVIVDLTMTYDPVDGGFGGGGELGLIFGSVYFGMKGRAVTGSSPFPGIATLFLAYTPDLRK
jgi:hypothetical protein